MQGIQFQYLQAVTGRKIAAFKEILGDTRLNKFLWMEFILNPRIVKIALQQPDNLMVRDALSKAASWYFAFRWLFGKNPEIEKLKRNNRIKVYPLRGEMYRKDRRNFLKGIVYAGLC